MLISTQQIFLLIQYYYSYRCRENKNLVAGILHFMEKVFVLILLLSYLCDLFSAIFGQSLEETMEYEHKKGRRLPYIVEKSIEFLEVYGLDTEGIFRYLML